MAPRTVRVVDYQVGTGDDDAGTVDRPYRLLTTLLDPDEVSVKDLIAAYHARWEIENTFDELKTHQRGRQTVLRSKSPELVHQEIWGHLCCHYAIRTLMADAAAASEHSPVRVSFVKALKIARRSVIQGCFPPDNPYTAQRLWDRAVSWLARYLNPPRRRRTNPRVIKRKMSKWPVKQSHHCGQPLDPVVTVIPPLT